MTEATFSEERCYFTDLQLKQCIESISISELNNYR